VGLGRILLRRSTKVQSCHIRGRGREKTRGREGDRVGDGGKTKGLKIHRGKGDAPHQR